MLIQNLIPGLNLEDYTNEFKGIIREGYQHDKQKEPSEISWLKELVGFANTQGGNLYIGVHNKTHEISPFTHEETDRLVLMIHRLVKLHIEPPIDYVIQEIPIPGTEPLRYVLCVSVKKTPHPPISLKFHDFGVIYVRHFGVTSVATNEEIRDLVMNSESFPFDTPFTQEDFHMEDFQILFSTYAENNPGEVLTFKKLVSIGFVSNDGKLAEGALLFKDNYCGDKSRVMCGQYRGLDKGVDVASFSTFIQKNLLLELKEIVNFVQSRSLNGFVKGGLNAIPLTSYPIKSLREGVINALAHRNYFINGSQIEINLYMNRLEIISPGSLLGSKWLKNEKNLASILPRRRNKLICDVFHLCKLMEEMGSGFDKIEKEYSSYGKEYAPYVTSTNEYFSLTLPDLSVSVVPESALYPSVLAPEKLSDKQEKILSFCYLEEHTVSEIAKMLGETASTYLRNSVLGTLIKKGFLLRLKQGKKVTYRTNRELVSISEL